MDVSYYKEKYEPIDGKWFIKELLGEGSYGKVFRIEREDMGGKYDAALKVITIPQSEKEIEINVQPCRTKEINMIVDGQEGVPLNAGDIIKITKLDKKVKLISSTEEKYYNTLRSKLNWTGGPHA